MEELSSALSDKSIATIQITKDFTGNLTIDRKVDFDLNGQTWNGNLTIQHTETGMIVFCNTNVVLTQCW